MSAKTASNYLVNQLSFYACYHSASGNKYLHFLFVPILLITGLSLFILYIPWFAIFDANVHQLRYFPVNTSTFYFYLVAYPLTYIYIDAMSGVSWLPIAFLVWFCANFLVMEYDWSVIIGVHVFSWIMQFVGHALIEKRSPALFKNFYASLVLAPLFVWFEMVIFPFGFYEKEHVQIKKIVKKFQEENPL